MRDLIYRLGSDPRRSVRRFLSGFALFILGLFFIYLGSKGEALWQVPGLIFAIPGFALACYGYLGIFCNRFSQFLNR
ncbi:hypothetical protein [Gallaecimonas xiamenensis]|uniref:Uncharacterized protein n=1 Tax=Gallaecimonas xiamenensis 3-C-1 TaxID=745411 RepID=K2KJM2_9GAMM|nr:hypothetical protein [Gallaecimonas xiamenensis]EKE77515.1 hypothetical protein B3C1_01850 [Gallaecimonas xiamenensis 3-C-1]